MKICLINNLYQPYVRGGAERIVELTAKGLSDIGHDVFIVSTKPSKSLPPSKKTDFKIYYINSLYYNIGRIPVFFRIFWHFVDIFDLVSFFKVRKIIKKEQPDLVVSNNLKGVSYLLPWLLKILKVSHVHVLHDIQLIHPSGLMMYGEEGNMDGMLSRLYSLTCKFLFSSPDLVISPSSWLLELHRDRGFFKKSKLAVLPNPVPKDICSNVSDFERGKNFTFLYVGQIEEYKGVFLLIDSFKDLFDDSVVLKIVGSGSALPRLMKKIRACKNIEYLGFKKTDAVVDLMKSSDCLVVPSLCYENSPTVIYEAASCGLYVLASALGGTKELVDFLGYSLFVPEKNRLQTKMSSLVSEGEEIKKLGHASSDKIKKYYLDNYIASVNNLFIDIVR